MPINEFGNSSSSHDNGKKNHTGTFVQKPYLRTNFIESNIEEDFDLKIQNEIKNIPDSMSIREAASKNYVDKKYNDANEIKKHSTCLF